MKLCKLIVRDQVRVLEALVIDHLYNRSEVGPVIKDINKWFAECEETAHLRITAVTVDDGGAWKRREQMRFVLGDNGEPPEYKRVPWCEETWFTTCEIEDHFVHLSNKEPDKVAYTPSAIHGADDRQTMMSVSKYLQRFYPLLGKEEADRWAGVVGAGVVSVQFARTTDAIVHVYENGPRSCMSHAIPQCDCDDCDGHCPYNSHVHPCATYGDSDLSVAYVENRGGIRARAVVWEARKRYGVIYGDSSRLQPLLRELGYSNGNFLGARIRRINYEEGNGLVLPYVDGSCFCRVLDDKWVELSDEGISTETTTGVQTTIACCECDTLMPDDDCTGQYSDHTDAWYCQNCFDDTFERCWSCEGAFQEQTMVKVVSHTRGMSGTIEVDGKILKPKTELWCEYCNGRRAFTCVGCDRRWSQGFFDHGAIEVPVANLRPGDVINDETRRQEDVTAVACHECKEASYEKCEKCGDWDTSEQIKTVGQCIRCVERDERLYESYCRDCDGPCRSEEEWVAGRKDVANA